MSLESNSDFKTMYHKQERKIVQDYVNCFKIQLKDVSELKEDLSLNPVYIQLKAKIEFGEKLLGKR